jgi:energy-converting hydrogenase Eha subunit G
VVVLPRLARALHHPAVEVALAVILIALGVIGLATDDIKKGYAIGIIVVGAISLLRALSRDDGGSDAPPPDPAP